MQPQSSPLAQTVRLDPRSLAAAVLCIVAPFFGLLGWVLAIAGIVLLRRAVLSRTLKWALAGVALAPKVLFLGVRMRYATEGLTFPIEPRNLAGSSSLWAWSILLATFGALIIVQSGRRRSLPLAGLGLAPILVAVVMLLGLTDGFHRIDDAGQGRWALRHAARGNVAVFSASDVASIDALERYNSRRGRDYSVNVELTDGRSFSVATKSVAALEEIRKFATTAGLPGGKVRIIRRNGGTWVNGSSGFTVKDYAGTYEATGESGRTRSTYEFWSDGGRLTGRETVVEAEGRHVRALRNVKVNDSGDVEFEPAAYVQASQQAKGRTVAFSFRWSAQGETGRFVEGGFESGLQKYRKR